MLGCETDVFLIDTKTGRVYNLGEEVGIKPARALMEKICGPHDVKYFNKRFVTINGVEWGVDSYNPKTKRTRSIYNPRVIRRGKRFASQY